MTKLMGTPPIIVGLCTKDRDQLTLQSLEPPQIAKFVRNVEIQIWAGSGLFGSLLADM